MPRGRASDDRLADHLTQPEPAPFPSYDILIAALVSNSEVYKGNANDAVKVIKLAQQILDEMQKGGGA